MIYITYSIGSGGGAVEVDIERGVLGFRQAGELPHIMNVRGLPPNTAPGPCESGNEAQARWPHRPSLTTCGTELRVWRIFGGGLHGLIGEEDTGSVEIALIEVFSGIPGRTSTLRAYEVRVDDPDLNGVPGPEGLEETDICQGGADDPLIGLGKRSLRLVGREVGDDVGFGELLNIDTLPT